MNVLSGVQTWLTWNNETMRMLLPVNPEELKITNSTKVDTYNLANGQPKAIPSDISLEKVSFSSLFPNGYCQGCVVDEPKSPREYAYKILELMDRKMPVHFFVTGRQLWSPRFTSYFLINKFDYSEKGGDPLSLNYSIELTEYPIVSVTKVRISGNRIINSTTTSRVFNGTANKIYTVKAGDTIVSICKANYGNTDSSTLSQVRSVNRDIMPNDNCLIAGMALMLPQLKK